MTDWRQQQIRDNTDDTYDDTKEVKSDVICSQDNMPLDQKQKQKQKHAAGEIGGNNIYLICCYC